MLCLELEFIRLSLTILLYRPSLLEGPPYYIRCPCIAVIEMFKLATQRLIISEKGENIIYKFILTSPGVFHMSSFSDLYDFRDGR